MMNYLNVKTIAARFARSTRTSSRRGWLLTMTIRRVKSVAYCAVIVTTALLVGTVIASFYGVLLLMSKEDQAGLFLPRKDGEKLRERLV
jgi:hypothetical protein